MLSGRPKDRNQCCCPFSLSRWVQGYVCMRRSRSSSLRGGTSGTGGHYLARCRRWGARLMWPGLWWRGCPVEERRPWPPRKWRPRRPRRRRPVQSMIGKMTNPSPSARNRRSVESMPREREVSLLQEVGKCLSCCCPLLLPREIGKLPGMAFSSAQCRGVRDNVLRVESLERKGLREWMWMVVLFLLIDCAYIQDQETLSQRTCPFGMTPSGHRLGW